MKKYIYSFILFLCGICLISAHGFSRQKEYCSLLDKCGLPYEASVCPDSLKTGIKNIDYDSARCYESQHLVAEGVSTTTGYGPKLFGFLGQRYRVDYMIKSTLPIKVEQFEYLLQDIPLAAKVVNAFQKTKYTAIYLDGEQKKYWRGNNGDNLSGEASLISGGIPEKKLVYFGFGIVKILKWKLKGQVLMEYEYIDKKDEPIEYDLKVVVFPGGAVVNAIMNMGMFKKVVKNKILEVFQHIVDSAAEMDKLTYEQMLKKYDWTDEDNVKIKELMTLRSEKKKFGSSGVREFESEK